MREMHIVASMLMGIGLGESVALVTGSRFPGSTRDPCIGYVSPEAMDGGAIAIVRDGDVIDIPSRTIALESTDQEINARLRMHPSARQSQEKVPEKILSACRVCRKRHLSKRYV
jgi:dihydroxy-acid dehydratase